MAKRKVSVRRKIFLFFVFASLLISLGVILISKEKAGSVISSCGVGDLTAEVISPDKFGVYEGDKVQVPGLLASASASDYSVLGVANVERWVEVDLSEQKVRAWEGDKLFLESLVSTGLPWYATPEGEFRVWAKVRATKMEGGEGRYYYYLPNVPYVMFFENTEVPGYRGFSLHGTYWHSDFGKVHSHGCVNLPTNVAEQLYYWMGPRMPEGKNYVRSSEENPGTRIVIHE